jgi:hypothetical protein
MDRQSHTIPASPENVSRFLDYFGVALGKFKFKGSEGSYLPEAGFQETYSCLPPISAGIVQGDLARAPIHQCPRETIPSTSPVPRLH